jgi:hypothetical protein
MAAVNAVIAVINVWVLARLLRTRHDETHYGVVAVGPTDEFLRHLLRREAGEIERWNPGFTWDGAAAGHLAFLVVREAEVVGMVLLADRGDGTARVELDYVLPRYRDFTPGEFVYRRSGLFASYGFHRVLAPERMVDRDYLQRVGFRPEGAELALEVR